MQRLHPQPMAVAPESGRAGWLAQTYRYPAEVVGERPWVRACMVSGLDGAAVWQGRSGGLSGPADAELLAVLRGLADVVLVGAGTARSERYGPADVHPGLARARLAAGQEPAPAIAVVSGSLDLDPGSDLFSRPPASPGARTLVITAARAPAAARQALERVAEVVVAGEEAVEPALAVLELERRGLRRVLCEGGPRLLAGLWAADLLDELCLTVSPMLTGGGGPRILHQDGLHQDGLPQDGLRRRGVHRRGGGGEAGRTPMVLAAVLAEDDFLFTRYTRQARA
ncbi:pyrimidine reductase family protein [Kitasatospora sp. NPDC056138]|uniref:pyrimidine reductase family protein n=1 Tax=Kitasatospora sp. NPDC056138 TaxID=3345724 RepID=UPI0035E0A0C6